MSLRTYLLTMLLIGVELIAHLVKTEPTLSELLPRTLVIVVAVAAAVGR